MHRTVPFLPQTFDMVFAQYVRHPEIQEPRARRHTLYGDTLRFAARYPVTASGFHLISKETERGCEQSEGPLLPSLMPYQDGGFTGSRLRQRPRQIPLNVLELETGLSRHIVRVRDGKEGAP